MELLLELLARFLLLPMLVLFADAAGVLLGGAVLFLESFCALAGHATLAISWKRWRRVRLTFLVLASLAVLAALLLNTVLFEPALRWNLSRWKAKTGIDVAFQSATGNWLTGRAEFKNLTVRRAGDARTQFDLAAAVARVDVRMTSLLGREVSFESVEIAGLRGTFERPAPPGERPRGREFTVDRLVISEASVLFRDRPVDEKPAEMKLTLERLECAPIRRRFAVFDALFRSNAKGTIDGAPFTVRSEGGPGGRSTFWHAENLPLRFLADYAGGGFAWFRSGRADFDVTDSWKDGEGREIDSHWKLHLKAPVAEVPATLTGWRRPIATAVAAFVNRHPVNLPLEFDLKINRDEFDGAVSLEASGLLAAAGGAVAKRLAELAELPAETIKELGRKGLEALKEALGRWRRPGKSP